MKTNIKKATSDMYEHISNNLTQGRKIAVPQAILDQEHFNLDEMSDYFIVEKGSFGLVNYLGFRRAI